MASSKPARILAIDAFRGVTIVLMICVNTLAGVRGMPAWMEHAAADADAMIIMALAAGLNRMHITLQL